MEAKNYSASELLHALNENRFAPPAPNLIGILKKSDHADHVAFSRQGCGHFIDIPAAMIESAQQIGWSNCGDHGHPVVRLQLREAETAEGKLLQSLLLQAQPAALYGGASPMAQPGAPFPAAAANRPPRFDGGWPPGGQAMPPQIGAHRSATGPGRWLISSSWGGGETDKDCPAAICDACCCLIFEPNPGGGCLVWFACWC
ncbi:MAG: hypothetical protein WCG00_00660 [Hyphomicrobiales bacterium]|nr:hypothetical protein [Hyphomicrobiales bacterium]